MRKHVLVLFAMIVFPDLVQAQRPTIREQEGSWLWKSFGEAPMLVVARVQNAVKPNEDFPDGKVDLVIDEVLVPHAALKGRKSIVRPRYQEAGPQKLLVAVEEFQGKLDPYVGQELGDKGEVVKYIMGGRNLKDKTPAGRIRFNLEFARSSDWAVSHSAYRELVRADYADLRKVAQTLQPEPWRRALQQGKNRAFDGVYALLLAHCGKKDDAALVRKLLDDAGRVDNERCGLLLFSYVLLDKEKGWPLVVQWVGDKTKERYGALCAIRHLADLRTDVVELKKCVEAFAGILDAPDFADFAIEDLRKRERWEYCDTILALRGKPEYAQPLITTAILRFALRCPTPAARAFVQAERKRNAKYVAETEELLDELDPPAKKK